MGLGMKEIVLLALVILIFFGAGRIPRLMGDIGHGITAFKRGIRSENSEI